MTGLNQVIPYSSGTWTPTDGSGASLVFTSVAATYSKVGNIVCVQGVLTYPVTVDGSIAFISGLPFSVQNAGSFAVGQNTTTAAPFIRANPGNSNIVWLSSSGAPVVNSALSGQQMLFSITYISA